MSSMSSFLLLNGTDRYKYGKLLKDMKNHALREKYPFSKTISEASYVFSKWKNQDGGKYDVNRNSSDKNE